MRILTDEEIREALASAQARPGPVQALGSPPIGKSPGSGGAQPVPGSGRPLQGGKPAAPPPGQKPVNPLLGLPTKPPVKLPVKPLPVKPQPVQPQPVKAQPVKEQPPASRTGGPAPQQPTVGRVTLSPAARPGASGKPFLNQGSSPAGKQLVGQLKGLSPEGMKVLTRLLRPEAQTALAQEQRRRESITANQQQPRVAPVKQPPAVRQPQADPVDPLTLKPILPKTRRVVRQSVGEGDPGTPVTVEEDPNASPWLGIGKTWGWLIPGVSAGIEGHEQIYEQWQDALEAGAVKRVPDLAPAGSAERKAQEASLRRLQPLVEAYNRELTQNLYGRMFDDVVPGDGVSPILPNSGTRPNLYLENGKRWNWKEFGAYLRQHGVKRLTPWETQLLNSAINIRKIEWANKAGRDQEIATDVAVYLAGEIAGGLLTPIVRRGLLRARRGLKYVKPLKKVVEAAEEIAPKVPRSPARSGPLSDPVQATRKLVRILAPNQSEIQNMISNGVQEGLAYAMKEPDPQADGVIRRVLWGGTLGYLFDRGLHLGAKGWKRLRRAYHQAGPRSEQEAERVFAAELRAMRAEAGHAEGAAVQRRVPGGAQGIQPHRATPAAEPHPGKQPLPGGRPGVKGKPAPHGGPNSAHRAVKPQPEVTPPAGAPPQGGRAPLAGGAGRRVESGHPQGRAAHPGAPPGMHPPEIAPVPAGKPGLPEAAPPPKRSTPEMEITAPEQKPGAVGVSGETGHPSASGGKSGGWRPVRRPQVHVNPEGRVHVEGHGLVEPHDAAALATVEDAFRRGGPEAKARALEALPPEQRSRVEGLWNDLEPRGALGDVAEAGRARRGAGSPGAADPQSPHSVPEPPAPRETVEPRSPEAGPAPHGEEPRPTRGNEPEPVVGEYGARAEAPTPETPPGDPRAELDASTRAWERTQGGRRYAGPEPHAVQAALPVARALQRIGVEGGEGLLAGLRRQLGAGHGEEFYRAVAAAVERDGTPPGGRPGTPRPEVAPPRTTPAGAGVPGAGSSPSLLGAVPEGRAGATAPQAGTGVPGGSAAPRPGGTPAGAPEGTPREAGTGGTAGSAAGSAVPDLAGGAAPRPGAGNRVFTSERAEAARQQLAAVLPGLRGGGSGRPLEPARPALMELGGFHYEAGARQFDRWAARLRGEVGADTLSTEQLQALWQKVKPATNKALNQAAQGAAGGKASPLPTLRPAFRARTTPTLAGPGLLASLPTEAVGLRSAVEAGGEWLAKTTSLPGALRSAPQPSRGRATIRWYEVGARPAFRPQREAMYAHLVARRPELAERRWSLPGHGNRTLRELLVERGVVPAELADRYAVAGAKARPVGGRARQEAARAASGYAPRFPEAGRRVGDNSHPGDESRLEGWIRKVRGLPPEVNIEKVELEFVDHSQAQEWALENIPGLKNVHFGSIDISVVQKFNEVVKAIADHFGVEVESIGPFGMFGYDYDVETPTMAARGRKIGFDQWNLVPGSIFDEFKRTLAGQEHTSEADKSIEAVIAHEMGHILQWSGRYQSGSSMDPDYSQWLARRIVEEYMEKQGEAQIIKELGERAAKGSRSYPDQPWRETWALAFGAYWIDRSTLSAETREMVERVLAKLYPDVR